MNDFLKWMTSDESPCWVVAPLLGFGLMCGVFWAVAVLKTLIEPTALSTIFAVVPVAVWSLVVLKEYRRNRND